MWNVTFEPGLTIFKSDSISFTAPALPYFVITTHKVLTQTGNPSAGQG